MKYKKNLVFINGLHCKSARLCKLNTAEISVALDKVPPDSCSLMIPKMMRTNIPEWVAMVIKSFHKEEMPQMLKKSLA